MKEDKPEMHRHDDLLEDLKYTGSLPDEVFLRWCRDTYSTSKHLMTLYNLVVANKFQNVLEIGFGRSSFVLAKACLEVGGKLTSVDQRDFSYLLNKKELSVVEFVNEIVSPSNDVLKPEYDFIFLDFLSTQSIPEKDCRKYLNFFARKLSEGGMMLIHDTKDSRYHVGKVLSKWLSKVRDPGLLIGSKRAYDAIWVRYNYGLTVVQRRHSRYFYISEDPYLKK